MRQDLMGWQCPNCLACFSPFKERCESCGPAKPPFINKHLRRAVKCELCAFEVRPGFKHDQCGKEGSPCPL